MMTADGLAGREGSEEELRGERYLQRN